MLRPSGMARRKSNARTQHTNTHIQTQMADTQLAGRDGVAAAAAGAIAPQTLQQPLQPPLQPPLHAPPSSRCLDHVVWRDECTLLTFGAQSQVTVNAILPIHTLRTGRGLLRYLQSVNAALVADANTRAPMVSADPRNATTTEQPRRCHICGETLRPTPPSTALVHMCIIIPPPREDDSDGGVDDDVEDDVDVTSASHVANDMS